MITFIGNVKLDRLADLGKIMSFLQKLFTALLIAVVCSFYRPNLNKKENNP